MYNELRSKLIIVSLGLKQWKKLPELAGFLEDAKGFQCRIDRYLQRWQDERAKEGDTTDIAR